MVTGVQGRPEGGRDGRCTASKAGGTAAEARIGGAATAPSCTACVCELFSCSLLVVGSTAVVIQPQHPLAAQHSIIRINQQHRGGVAVWRRGVGCSRREGLSLRGS